MTWRDGLSLPETQRFERCDPEVLSAKIETEIDFALHQLLMKTDPRRITTLSNAYKLLLLAYARGINIRSIDYDLMKTLMDSFRESRLWEKSWDYRTRSNSDRECDVCVVTIFRYNGPYFAIPQCDGWSTEILESMCIRCMAKKLFLMESFQN